jgi:oligopeptide/dipeptide ABC transporter ATP-binding protein
VNLLVDLQKELGTAMLFISHNLAVIRHLSHRVLVIYRGRLVEVADCDELFGAPAHPYTQALLAAVPDPTRVPEAIPIAAVEATPAAVPRTGGCAFAERCAFAQDRCRLIAPPQDQVGVRHTAACHRWREVVYSWRHETRNSRAR